MSDQPLRVAIETFGCRSNYADTLDLQASLVEHGAVPCRFDSEADVYVVNSCTVTNDADASVLQLIRQARRNHPHARIVVTGCMAESNPEAIAGLDLADAIVGTGKKQQLLRSIYGEGNASEQHSDADFAEDALHPVHQPISPALAGPGQRLGEVRTRSRHHLRIQEGCENSCTFCIIPQSRGKLVSRAPERILEDLSRLCDLGYQEVVLTGTHLGGWGEDRGESLTELLEMLAEKSPLRRLRLSSLDPNDVSKQLIDVLSSSDAFCNHLHICIQAFSNATLKRMNRRYRLPGVVELLEYLAERWPGCAVGSDLITGFPGESRQDVDQGLETFLALPISYLHVFPFSERTGTAAAEYGATRLGGSIPPAERRRRAARFRALSDRRKLEFYRTLVGRELEVVVEAERKTPAAAPRSLVGTSREFAAVRLLLSDGASPVDSSEPGSLIRCRADAIDETRGEIICRSFVRGK